MSIILKNIIIKGKDKLKLKWLILIPVLIAGTFAYRALHMGSDVKVDKDPSLQASIYNSYDEENLNISTDEEDEKEIVTDIYVDVGGAVVNPKVVCIPEGSRVFEAIDSAGGISGNAETKYMNMAAICKDGEKIYVPTEAEIKSDTGKDPLFNREIAVSNGNSSSYGGSGSNALININTAGSSELQTLSGIGPSMADRILEYRTQNGKFSSIEDLKNVSGIGDKKFGELKDHICV